MKCLREEEPHRRINEWGWIYRLTTALKRVDLPTLGRPTIPAFKLMLTLDAKHRFWRVKTPTNLELPENNNWFLHKRDVEGKKAKAVTTLVQAALAIVLIFSTSKVLFIFLLHITENGVDWSFVFRLISIFANFIWLIKFILKTVSLA